MSLEFGAFSRPFVLFSERYSPWSGSAPHCPRTRAPVLGQGVPLPGPRVSAVGFIHSGFISGYFTAFSFTFTADTVPRGGTGGDKVSGL